MSSDRRLPDPREKPWLTVAELAAITGEGQKVIRAAVDAGQLPSLRIGRYVRIPTAALLRLLAISEAGADEDLGALLPFEPRSVENGGRGAS